MTQPTRPDQPVRCHGGVCVRMGGDGTDGLCSACTTRLAGWVADLPGLWVRVHMRLAGGQAAGERVSGGGEAPIPADADVLSFLGPGSTGWTTLDGADDGWLDVLQVGPAPLLGRLEATVQQVCEELHLSWPRPAPLPPFPPHRPRWPYGPPTAGNVEEYRQWQRSRQQQTWPHRQADALLRFLGRWGTWIAGHAWADEYAQDVYGCWRTARALAGVLDPPPELVRGVWCPRCDGQALYRIPGEDGRSCVAREGGCGRWLSEDEFDRWVRLSAHFAKEAG